MKKINRILSYFDELFIEPKCALNFSSAYELLIAVILSAQCTDARVNKVTEVLFAEANTAESMLILGEDKLKNIIYPCGFYNNKSKAIIQASKDIVNKFNGQVPDSLEKLTSLSGVGRKTANVVLSNVFNHQAIAVDTHVLRVSKRLSLTSPSSNPTKCEQDLLKIVPKNSRTRFHHQTVLFGRNICKAIKPNCEICKLKEICTYYKNKRK